MLEAKSAYQDAVYQVVKGVVSISGNAGSPYILLVDVDLSLDWYEESKLELVFCSMPCQEEVNRKPLGC